MGLFDFARKEKTLAPITKDTLPESRVSLESLGRKYYQMEDYASAIFCYEKLLTLKVNPDTDYKFCDAVKTLAECYAQGKGCQQDLDKAKEIYDIYVKSVFAGISGALETRSFEIFCSSYCNGPDDHKRIFRMAAEGYAWCQEAGNGSVDPYKFEFLRGLIHLSESGMKYAVGEDAVRNFLNAPKETEDGFWKGWPMNWYGMTPDELRPFINEDRYFHITIYQFALRKTMDEKLTPTQKDIKMKEVWKREFPGAPLGYTEQARQLRQKFKEKYGTMTAQELLDCLYAEEAAWQAAHSAEAKAAEAARIAEEERVAAEKIAAQKQLEADSRNEQNAELAALEQLVDMYMQQKEFGKALKFAIEYAKADNTEKSAEKGWDKYGDGVLNGEADAMQRMYQFYKYSHVSVGKAFGEACCAVLRPYAEDGNLEACTELFFQLYDMYQWDEAYEWADKAIRGKHPRMLLEAATRRADDFGLDDYDVTKYLKEAATGSGMYAEWARDCYESHVSYITQKQRQEWAQIRKQAEAQQERIDQQVNNFRGNLDMLERDLDLAFGGDGYTMEERVLQGKASAMDGVRHQMLRDNVEEKFRSKF